MVVPACHCAIAPLAAIFAALSWDEARADGVPIGAYAFWNRGTTRSIALGGATVSEGFPSSGTFENPAAMGFQRGVVTGTAGWGSPADKGIVPTNSTVLGSSYRILGASVSLWELLALGAGLEELSLSSESRPRQARRYTFRDEISAIDFTGAMGFGSWLALGGTLVSHDSFRQVTVEEEGLALLRGESRAAGETWRVGALLRPVPTLSLGVAYRSESRLSLSQRGAQAARLFSESYEPAVTQIGMSWRPWGGLPHTGISAAFLALQCDVVSFRRLPQGGRLYYAPAAVFGAQDAFELELRSTSIPRLALELPIWNNSLSGFVTRLGSYYEPTYVKGQKGRWHGTAGILLRVWYLALQGAIDSARSYNNWNYGVGLEFDF